MTDDSSTPGQRWAKGAGGLVVGLLVAGVIIAVGLWLGWGPRVGLAWLSAKLAVKAAVFGGAGAVGLGAWWRNRKGGDQGKEPGGGEPE